jgi:hypothetical protein
MYPVARSMVRVRLVNEFLSCVRRVERERGRRTSTASVSNPTRLKSHVNPAPVSTTQLPTPPRLFQFTIAKSSNDPERVADAIPYRKNATLTNLTASRLEQLVNIWSRGG